MRYYIVKLPIFIYSFCYAVCSLSALNLKRARFKSSIYGQLPAKCGCAGGEIRTHVGARPQDLKSCAFFCGLCQTRLCHPCIKKCTALKLMRTSRGLCCLLPSCSYHAYPCLSSLSRVSSTLLLSPLSPVRLHLY